MLNINNLTVNFGARYLFDNIGFNLSPGDRVGLIGRNGSGKTTLLKILAGIELIQEGTINKPNGYTIGYLPQEGNFTSEKQVIVEIKDSLREIKEIEEQINETTEKIQHFNNYDSEDYLSLLDKLALLNERFRILGGNSIESEIEKVLTGLGFKRDEFYKKVSNLSGGWQMRIELAKILLQKPDCILLDEPSNHLDIDSIRWLEQFLCNYEKAMIIVSHDRKFLDSVTNRTIEIANSKLYSLNAPYSKFIEFREEQKKIQINQFKNQQKEIEETERFIERFRYKATLASRVQSRIKQLEKIERIEVEEEDYSRIKFDFPPSPNSGRLIAEVKNLNKSYGDNHVLRGVNFSIERGEKVAFIGRNGEGKTTLTKILAGMETYQGFVSLGYNVSTGYFAQHQADLLDGEDTVFSVIDNAAIGEIRTRIRSLLGAFLFSGDSINKKVKVLSGGEKSRLALAKLLLEPVNFLILDEPTNHLDMVSKDVLKKSLMKFDGSLIIVSHDRDFLTGLTNKTIYFTNGRLVEYPGDINDFLELNKTENLSDLEQRLINSKDNDNQIVQKDKIAREKSKQTQKERNKLQNSIKKIEEEIFNIENEIKELELKFASPDFYNDLEKALSQQELYKHKKDELNQIYKKWEELTNLLENN